MKADWVVEPLNEVCEIRPNKKLAKNELSEKDLVSFVGMSELGELKSEFLPRENRELEKVYKGYTYFADGDVLVAKITPCFENGKMGIASNLTNGIGFGSSEFVPLRPNGKITSKFLFYFLLRDEFRESGARVMSGAVGHKRVPKEYMQELPVPLPPLEEQKRIVAILDEAFEGLDRACAHTEANLQNAKELFESHAEGEIEKCEKSFAKKPLGEICENLDRQRVPITKNKRVAGDVPYYGASGVVDHVKDFLFDEDLLLISEDGANLLARNYPIAFSISGKTWVNNHAHVLRFGNEFVQEFVSLFFNSISIEPWVSGMAQPKLNQKSLNGIPIPMPDKITCERIVLKAKAIMETSVDLQNAYKSKLDDLDDLRQSLLQKAFAGELT